ncbi:MAG: hypothetical protein LBC45_04135 [Chlamydiales bacterium]|jgi:predicted nucleotidyltransferase|nr:hypothetical protein [Chlamydiales bacterium]
MTTFRLHYSPSFPLENDFSDQPLDLSLTLLEKKVIRRFKDRFPIRQISEKLNVNIDEIYSIISKTSSIKIKDFKGYTKDIKYRFKEAQNAGKTIAEIQKIFKLKRYQATYINRCVRSFLIKQLCQCINAIPNRDVSPMTIERLKKLLHSRRIQQFKEI